MPGFLSCKINNSLLYVLFYNLCELSTLWLLLHAVTDNSVCVFEQQSKGDAMTDSANADNDSLYDNDQE